MKKIGRAAYRWASVVCLMHMVAVSGDESAQKRPELSRTPRFTGLLPANNGADIRTHAITANVIIRAKWRTGAECRRPAAVADTGVAIIEAAAGETLRPTRTNVIVQYCARLRSCPRGNRFNYRYIAVRVNLRLFCHLGDIVF